VSQIVAVQRGDAEVLEVVVALLVWWLPWLFGGAALALVLRAAATRLGQMGFGYALGGALGALALPLAMALSFPRATLLVGLVLGAAAFSFAFAARRAKPRWAMMATLPLAVTALFTGDIGEPWIKIRTDVGASTRVAHQEWTPQGVIAVDRVQRGKTQLRVDRNSQVDMWTLEDDGRVPRLLWRDLAYAVEEPVEGPALVINSLGAREIALALAYEHPRVDVVQLDAAVLRELLLDRYAALTRNILWHPTITMHVGDARAALGPDAGYQRVLVLGDARYLQSAPRLLMDRDRLFTVEAIRAYLGSLDPARGQLMMSLLRGTLPSVLAASVAAMEGDPKEALTRVFACTARGHSQLLVRVKPLSAKQLRELTKHCKSKAGTVEYPLEEPRRGHRQRDTMEAQRHERLQVLMSGVPATDERPFVIAPPAPQDIVAATLESVRALEPYAVDGDGQPLEKRPSKADEDAGEQDEGPPPDMRPVGVAVAAISVLACIMLLLWLLPPPRGQDGQRAPLTVRVAMPGFGMALGVALFTLTEGALTVMGDSAYGWGLFIPVGLVGVAGGRLLSDTIDRARLGTALTLVMLLGLLWVAALHALVPRLAGLGSGTGSLLALVMLTLVTGALLGAPLVVALRRIGSGQAAAIGSCWGLHHVGLGLGGALAAAMVVYLGVSQLMVLSAAGYLFGVVVLATGSGRRRPAASEAAVSAPPQ
jgi:hypothetical protein